MRPWVPVSIVVCVLLITPAEAQIDQLLRDLGRGLGQSSGLSEARIAAGLKEALQVGSENAVRLAWPPTILLRSPRGSAFGSP